MRSIPLLAPIFAFTAAFTAYGCTLDVSGADPAKPSGGGAGPSSATASSGQTGGMGGMDSTSTASSAGTGCASPDEICDNGVDDNCDGLADCADPQCATPVDGRACVPAAPAGWTFTTLAPDMGGACPAGYDTPVLVATPPTSAASTCICNCGPTVSNPCTKGKLTVKIGSGCSSYTLVSDVTGACDQLGSTFPGAHNSCGGAVVPVAQVSCSVTVSKPNPVPSGVEVTCAPTESAAGGCGGDQVCLPKVASANLCIQAKGDLSCPAGPFTARRLVGTPGDVSDNRTCDACTCASDATSCNGATFTAYTDASCTANPVTATIDGTCQSGMGGKSFSGDTYFKYQATPNVDTCTPSAATPALTGGFAPNNPTTICCQP